MQRLAISNYGVCYKSAAFIAIWKIPLKFAIICSRRLYVLCSDSAHMSVRPKGLSVIPWDCVDMVVFNLVWCCIMTTFMIYHFMELAGLNFPILVQWWLNKTDEIGISKIIPRIHEKNWLILGLLVHLGYIMILPYYGHALRTLPGKRMEGMIANTASSWCILTTCKTE